MSDAPYSLRRKGGAAQTPFIVAYACSRPPYRAMGNNGPLASPGFARDPAWSPCSKASAGALRLHRRARRGRPFGQQAALHLATICWNTFRNWLCMRMLTWQLRRAPAPIAALAKKAAILPPTQFGWRDLDIERRLAVPEPGTAFGGNSIPARILTSDSAAAIGLRRGAVLAGHRGRVDVAVGLGTGAAQSSAERGRSLPGFRLQPRRPRRAQTLLAAQILLPLCLLDLRPAGDRPSAVSRARQRSLSAAGQRTLRPRPLVRHKYNLFPRDAWRMDAGRSRRCGPARKAWRPPGRCRGSSFHLGVCIQCGV